MRATITALLRVGFEAMKADTDASSEKSGNRSGKTFGTRPIALDANGDALPTPSLIGLARVFAGGNSEFVAGNPSIATSYWFSGTIFEEVFEKISRVHD